VHLLLDAGASVANLPEPPPPAQPALTEKQKEAQRKQREEAHASPLHAAIAELHHSLVDRLLDLGADANAHDPLSASGTPLASASRWGKVDIMKKLVDRGADPSLAGADYG